MNRQIPSPDPPPHGSWQTGLPHIGWPAPLQMGRPWGCWPLSPAWQGRGAQQLLIEAGVFITTSPPGLPPGHPAPTQAQARRLWPGEEAACWEGKRALLQHPSLKEQLQSPLELACAGGTRYTHAPAHRAEVHVHTPSQLSPLGSGAAASSQAPWSKGKGRPGAPARALSMWGLAAHVQGTLALMLASTATPGGPQGPSSCTVRKRTRRKSAEPPRCLRPRC